MATYKVKSLYAFGLHKTFRSGDIVTDKDFTDGHAPQMVMDGFLEEIPEPEAEQSTQPAAEAQQPPQEDNEPPKNTTAAAQENTGVKPNKGGKKK